MARLENVHTAIQHIYEAVVSPERWPQAVSDMVAASGSDRGFLFAAQLGTPVLSVAAGLDQEHSGALQRELQTRLPDWMKRIPPGVARRQSSEISDADFKRTYIYSEVVKPEGMFYGLILPVARISDREIHLTTVGRRLGAADYGDEDVSATALLAPHLSAALNVRSRLVAADLRVSGAFDVLARLDLGVILLDENARPLFVNPYAEALSRARDGLLISQREVSSLVFDDAKKLRAVISSALEFNAVRKASDLQVRRALRCYITRCPPRLPLIVRVIPVTRCDSSGGLSAIVRVILFVLDPDRRAEIDWPVIAETFGLTRREAELAVLLARGMNMGQAAVQMHIKLDTARSYLKAIQGKTQTHRQSELVSLLLRSGLHVLR